MTSAAPEHLDVLIVGAGLSGISAAWHLQTHHPARRYAILEARDAMGGTWDLFRYPGIRSDSDKYTFGYHFRPWRGDTPLADGADIKAYIEDTAREYGIDEHIRFGNRMLSASWSSAESRWTVRVQVAAEAEPRTLTCDFLYACTGYYDYDKGHSPTWEGQEDFGGQIVHPQHWPRDLDLADKRVVVIGSGATAITLVPALAGKTARVTMLQRSPTYVAPRPRRDPLAGWLQRTLPATMAHALIRWRYILEYIATYQLARRRPATVRRALRQKAERYLGPDFDIEAHFQPHYEPWDQRVCVAPDGDLFRVLRDGEAHIVTDHIERFDASGLVLRSGEHLDADVVITATGLTLKLLAGVALEVDGQPFRMNESMSFKGMMYSGLPNFALAFGYTNASWTLKCDLIAQHVCKVLAHMDRNDLVTVVPRHEPDAEQQPIIDMTSGYIQRALAGLPRQGRRSPWRLHQNYLPDLLALRYGRVVDPGLEFRSRAQVAAGDVQPITPARAHQTAPAGPASHRAEADRTPPRAPAAARARR